MIDVRGPRPRRPMHVLVALLAATVLPTAAGAAEPAARFPIADRRFEALVERYLDGHYAFNPDWATLMGVHKYDDRLGDRSRPAIDREMARIRSALAELRKIDPARLGEANRIDYDLFRSQAQGHLFNLEEIRRWENDPNAYNYGDAILNLISRAFDTPEARLGHVITRLEQVPGLFESARANLRNPPRLFTEFAAEDLAGLRPLLESEVPQALREVKDPALLARYEKAKRGALEATDRFAEWLRADLLPRSKGTYVLGAERYRKQLLYEDMIDTPLDSLLAIGARELTRLEARYAETGAACVAAIAGDRPPPGSEALDVAVAGLRVDHPTASGLIPYVEGLLEDLRAYCVRSGFIAVPSEVRCAVRPTPEFQASRSFASLDAPGPFETVADEAYYAVTLPRADWDSTRTEQHLQGYSRWTLPSVSIHEAYPGHFVHFLHAKAAPTLARKGMGCGSFAEGWGLYVEEALFDHGYGNHDPKMLFGMLRWALIRACRLQVGIRVHAKGMTMDEAVRYFMDHARLERPNAEREAYRAAFNPTYSVYTIGALQIRKLRADVARAQGVGFDLARFHASLLSQGSLPVALLRRIALGDSGPTL